MKRSLTSAVPTEAFTAGSPSMCISDGLQRVAPLSEKEKQMNLKRIGGVTVCSYSLSRALGVALLVAVTAWSGSSQAGATHAVSFAEFESGVDPRGSIGFNPAGLATAGPYYAWETPQTAAQDDVNYWDVTSNGDGVNSPVDYELNFAPQDWRGQTALHINFYAWTDNGSGGGLAYNGMIRVYAWDSALGNSDGNGFENLGDFIGGVPIKCNLGAMANRGSVSIIKIRVYESFFGGVGAVKRQRTHLYSIRLAGERPISIDALDPVTHPYWTQYSPYVMHEAGWDRYRMYFGRNATQEECPPDTCSAASFCAQDRIYLSQNFGDGISGWEAPIELLAPSDSSAYSGERGLIHDPAVVIVGSTWHYVLHGH